MKYLRTIKTIPTRLWLRYRVARLLWVNGRGTKTSLWFVVPLVIFETLRPNPSIQIRVTKGEKHEISRP